MTLAADSRPGTDARSPAGSPQRDCFASPASSRSFQSATSGSSLADVLERVLDKGVVIAGDITVSVGATELLNIRIRLLIASVDKAKEMGINWWENNAFLSAQSQHLLETNQQLQTRIDRLETELRSLKTQQI